MIESSNTNARKIITREYFNDKRSHYIPANQWQRELHIFEKIAAEDIYELLRKNPCSPPLNLIESYRDRMEAYSNKEHSIRTSAIFSIMYDTSNDIIDMLIC